MAGIPLPLKPCCVHLSEYRIPHASADLSTMSEKHLCFWHALKHVDVGFLTLLPLPASQAPRCVTGASS
jgi:hypothetical protein